MLSDDLWAADLRLIVQEIECSATGVARGRTARDARRSLRAAMAEQGRTGGKVETLTPLHLVQRAEAQTLAWSLGDQQLAAIGPPARTDLPPEAIAGTQFVRVVLDAPGPSGVPASLEPMVCGPLDLATGAANGAIPAGLFALLDAGRVFGLAERVEGEGLEAACLFNGKTAEDYGDVAPWIVRLTPGCGLLKEFFDQDPDDQIGRTLRGQGAGILLRSSCRLPTLRKHFRRFTMLHDKATNRRVFFRFWAPETLRTLIAYMQPQDRAELMRGVSIMIGADGTGAALAICEEAVCPTLMAA